MIDIKQDKKLHIKPDPPDLLLAEAEVREKDPKKPHRVKTDGEWWTDFGTFKILGFGINEAISIFGAAQFEHGFGKKWLKPFLRRWSTSLNLLTRSLTAKP